MTAGSRGIAVLDVDGTLTPSMLGLELLRTLDQDGVCRATDRNALRILVERSRSERGTTYARTVADANAGFAAVLAGLPTAHVADAARRTWRRVEGDLFPFVPSLLSTLRGHGLHIVLLSGSPHEVIRAMAAHLGVRTCQGAVMAAPGGVYNGRVRLPTGVPGVKRRALGTLLRGHRIDFARSYALGNTDADAEILRLVGVPVAYEPDRGLRERAGRADWPIADRHSVVARTRAALHGAEQGAHPAHGHR
ncbi:MULTISPECIES: HAD family hydrolase [Streptomyces]|uniref:HAD family hydrolase n=1 Tax=Streptomyces TaxID=1883 RepID=UPI0019640A35|nr:MULTISPECIES: haloacid dehalogenase-like hydrolase [Streptomyces]QRX95975.1 haloacid dehalogenase-like hydrolase [Streptomyces noursei]UJB45256.1 haloacid dehalogenase-like hydrolase [Streptomyces sp. A1-5]